MFTKNERLEIKWLPPYESLGGLLGVAVFDPDHLPCLDQLHLPLGRCPPLEVALPLDLHLYCLEPVPHLELRGCLHGR
jgi:hypothetical protein